MLPNSYGGILGDREQGNEEVSSSDMSLGRHAPADQGQSVVSPEGGADEAAGGGTPLRDDLTVENLRHRTILNRGNSAGVRDSSHSDGVAGTSNANADVSLRGFNSISTINQPLNINACASTGILTAAHISYTVDVMIANYYRRRAAAYAQAVAPRNPPGHVGNHYNSARPHEGVLFAPRIHGHDQGAFPGNAGAAGAVPGNAGAGVIVSAGRPSHGNAGAGRASYGTVGSAVASKGTVSAVGASSGTEGTDGASHGTAGTVEVSQGTAGVLHAPPKEAEMDSSSSDEMPSLGSISDTDEDDDDDNDELPLLVPYESPLSSDEEHDFDDYEDDYDDDYGSSEDDYDSADDLDVEEEELSDPEAADIRRLLASQNHNGDLPGMTVVHGVSGNYIYRFGPVINGIPDGHQVDGPAGMHGINGDISEDRIVNGDRDAVDDHNDSRNPFSMFSASNGNATRDERRRRRDRRRTRRRLRRHSSIGNLNTTNVTPGELSLALMEEENRRLRQEVQEASNEVAVLWSILRGEQVELDLNQNNPRNFDARKG